ncbi:MAG: FAD-dependent oxidoreductase [Kiritimatiellae bacterium]|nr:FAD-dependent oxidoreductase [Kiritimatiellia bacterium]
MRTMHTINEPARMTPVAHECDICIVGGSGTGVFAAVRAARLGASVALIEQHGFFGGTATAGLVNVWHSLYDTSGANRIIGGLTREVEQRLLRRGGGTEHRPDPGRGFTFNSAELTVLLDDLVREHARIRPFLHARFVQPLTDGARVTHAIIEDASGRRAVKARVFIDASGNGDLLARAGLSFRQLADLQPPTTCVVLAGLDQVAAKHAEFNLAQAVFDEKHPDALPRGFLWGAGVPGVRGARMIAGTRVSHADCSDADRLTHAEMEGRRQARAIRDIVRARFEGGDAVAMLALPAHIGVRETRHADCLHRLTEKEVLEGVRFPDAIANGSYRVDVHHSDRPGLTFRYLDGTEVYAVPGRPPEKGLWREPRGESPTFYQIPYRSLVPKDADNVLVAGRLMDADRGAYGAVRVMVNCNQTGEAAGTAAYLACEADTPVSEVDAGRLRELLGLG